MRDRVAHTAREGSKDSGRIVDIINLIFESCDVACPGLEPLNPKTLWKSDKTLTPSNGKSANFLTTVPYEDNDAS